jgi:hypothetical protein
MKARLDPRAVGDKPLHILFEPAGIVSLVQDAFHIDGNRAYGLGIANDKQGIAR